MKHSLYQRFILTYLLFALASFSVVALLSSRLSYRAHLNDAASRLYNQARTVAESYESLYASGSLPAGFRTQLTGISRYIGIRIWFVSPDGQISYDSGGVLNQSMVPDFDPAGYPRNYHTGSFSGLFPEEMLSVLAPITAGLQIRGYVIMHRPLKEVHRASDRMLMPLYLTAGIIFLLSLSLLGVFHLYVMRPLKKITAAAGEYSSGNLHYTISVNQSDEIGYLADTLNVMADEISSSEQYQKRFIANVSHDFRSPLTSIKGYLAAIADGTIPPENQEKYIRVVIHETERLENLTQSMLSLNSLDRQNMHLEVSDFDICELIRNVCATFEGKCLMRDISFDLLFASASVAVHGDLGKIQQVLYNLLDNAIKFSKNGSSITISVRILKNKALISVKDSGIGISRKDLKQIWTRFFKSDASRGLDKQGTGLGLSIVKEIITAHGETIDVVSTEGAGTEFVFRLPLAGEKPAGKPAEWL